MRTHQDLLQASPAPQPCQICRGASVAPHALTVVNLFARLLRYPFGTARPVGRGHETGGNAMNVTKNTILSITLALALHAPAAVAQNADDDAKVDSREFVNSCASCHGLDGKGAGFLTRVFRGVDPGDLTLLAQNNGGTFPLEDVFAVIDGRAEVAAHGDRKMPVWGDRYMGATMTEWGPDELNELRIRSRIYGLVYYLQSIQETGSQ